MIESINMRHFPQLDPPGQKDKERAEVYKQMADFIAKGGQVQAIPEAVFGRPYSGEKRTRADQIDHFRSTSYRRRMESNRAIASKKGCQQSGIAQTALD